MQTKICTKCNMELPLTDFYKDSNGKYGVKSKCKICLKQYDKIHKRIYYQNNKNKKLEYNKIYYIENKKDLLENQKQWYRNNKEIVLINHRKYHKHKINADVNYKLMKTLRCRISKSIKNQSSNKAYKTIDLLGCTIEEARNHIETQFKDGMTWDNHGTYGWHIDHIKPCSSFDLTDQEQQKQCFHYTNLQPLWADENLSKGDKIIS